jgi:LacI family transcriptional regulator
MAKEKKATIYDVASEAGVAISTVSRVLNNSNDVSKSTRERVEVAIEALQFRPDRTAKKLAQKQTQALAVAIPTFTTPFHNELLKGARNGLRDRNVDLLLFDLTSREPERTLNEYLKRGTVDGLLLVGVTPKDDTIRELRALRAPVVLLGAHSDVFDCFLWDNVAGARAAVEHLIERGHRRIAMMVSHTEQGLQHERVDGYRQALQQAGIPFDQSLIQAGETPKHGGFSEEAGEEAMLQLLQRAPDVTAVFASSDVQAIGAMKALRDTKKRVPEDVALVGYDDIKPSRFIGLSSVDQEIQQVGFQAASLLLERMTGKRRDETATVRIQSILRIRESSAYQRTA